MRISILTILLLVFVSCNNAVKKESEEKEAAINLTELQNNFSDLKNYFGEERKCSVSREISKRFEETVRGSLKEVAEHFKKNSPKGEFVVCIAGKNSKD